VVSVQFLTILVAGVLLGGIYALVSVGLNLIFGVTRVVNFAQGEFVMLGMYGAFVARAGFGLDPYVSALIVAPLMFLLGVAVQRYVFQPLLEQPMMQLFASFGLLILLQNIVLLVTGGQAQSVLTGYSGSALDLGGVSVSVPRLVIFVLTTALTAALVLFLKRTFLGTAIRSVSQDRRAARLMGIDVERTYLFTFGLGAGLAGLAGVLLAPLFTLTPEIGFSFILPAFAVVVLGGLGSVTGAYVGGLLVGVVESLAGYYIDPSLKQAFWFTLFVAVLVVRPAGLLGRAGSEEVGTR
jgi:branched-chain amino acid transport system permease protein